MDTKKEKERVIKSSIVALKQLDKLIQQDIDLTELDPEKAKAAAQGKIEAIKGSVDIIEFINKLKDELDESAKPDNKESKEEGGFGGVEGFVPPV